MKRIQSATLQKLRPDPYEFEAPRNQPQEEDYPSSNKQFAFLSNIGGKNTTLTEITGETQKLLRPQSEIPQARQLVSGKTEGDISIFFNSNVDKSEKPEPIAKKIPRTHTVSAASLLTRTESGNYKSSSKRIIIRPTTSNASLPIQQRPMTAQ